MRFSTILPMLLAAGIAEAQNKNNGQNNNGQNNNNNNALQLNPNNVQKNSNNNGLAQAEAGQAASATDPANFINFCTGKTLTNGLQVKGGSCNGIVMGDIPSNTNMISAVMVFPQNDDVVPANQPIDFQVQIQNLVAGKFTNPDITYYAAPQALQGGKVVGHTHITVQDMAGNAKTKTPLNPQNFAFFKGINDAGNGNGLLKASLAKGLPAGVYRVCSMTSASNHQPVLMPVAQRGAQDDCVRFTVSNNAGNNNGGNNNANNANNANNGQNNANNANNGQNNANNGQKAGQNNGQQNNGQQQGQGNKGGRRFGRPKFSAREFIA